MALSLRKVNWSNEAKRQLKSLYNYIKKDWVKNASKVRNDLTAITRKLPLYPEIYSLDKYKTNNDSSYRAFEKHHYHVAYRVTATEILILRIRHTSMEPLTY